MTGNEDQYNSMPDAREALERLKASKLDLRPATYEMGPLPVGPVAMPGRTPLV